MILSIAIVSILVGLLFLERILISRRVRSIHHRIHVNGTRGKSSVTKYISDGLRGDNRDVMSKVTGVKPLIYHNGTKTDIRRRGMARVQEQFSTISLASSKNVHSLVLECMSISPDLQRLESRIFRPHIYVITNIKDDHREVLGHDINDQVEAICRAIPGDCVVVTAEKTYLSEIMEQAAKMGSRVVVADQLVDEIAESLPSGIFSENISLALEVCKLSGEDYLLAWERIFRSILDDEPVMRVVNNGEKEFSFLNAFSANDVNSTNTIIDQWRSTTGYKGKLSVIFNTRADRPLRTDAFTEWLAGIRPIIDQVIITGSHSIRARKKLVRSGMDRGKVQVRKTGHITKDALFKILNNKSMVVGIGNIGKEGHQIIAELK